MAGDLVLAAVLFLASTGQQKAGGGPPPRPDQSQAQRERELRKPATQADVQALRDEIDQLREELAELRRALRLIRGGPDTREAVARTPARGGNKPAVGMTVDEVRKALAPAFNSSRVKFDGDGYQLIEWGQKFPMLNGDYLKVMWVTRVENGLVTAVEDVRDRLPPRR